MARRLGPDLERAIRKANLSPADVARFAGVSPRWLHSIMAGAPVRPGSKKLARLTEAIGLLGVEPSVSQPEPVVAPGMSPTPAQRPGAAPGELAAATGQLAAAAAAISAQTASLVTLARNVADLADSQARLDRTLVQLVAALNGLLAEPAPPPDKRAPS
ncbi:MAG TPA: helix-turn-helix transcriptional regulator [Candidatus Acidoferrales bacterium]|nr:helix-turn-helix transcriptional regulator [Candidatus Acidoferrales bacterium]